jgi:hypothetical protein
VELAQDSSHFWPHGEEAYATTNEESRC